MRPSDGNRAAADLLQPGNHPQRGGLPAAGGSHEHHELPVLDGQVDFVDRADAGAALFGKDLEQVLDDDFSHAWLRAGARPGRVNIGSAQASQLRTHADFRCPWCTGAAVLRPSARALFAQHIPLFRMASNRLLASTPLTFELPSSLVDRIHECRGRLGLKSASDVVRRALAGFDFAGFQAPANEQCQISVRLAPDQKRTLLKAARQKKSERRRTAARGAGSAGRPARPPPARTARQKPGGRPRGRRRQTVAKAAGKKPRRKEVGRENFLIGYLFSWGRAWPTCFGSGALSRRPDHPMIGNAPPPLPGKMRFARDLGFEHRLELLARDGAGNSKRVRIVAPVTVTSGSFGTPLEEVTSLCAAFLQNGWHVS